MKISLSDTWPGIPRHALKKVFDDFFRVDNELNWAIGGTGPFREDAIMTVS